MSEPINSDGAERTLLMRTTPAKPGTAIARISASTALETGISIRVNPLDRRLGCSNELMRWSGTSFDRRCSSQRSAKVKKFSHLGVARSATG